MRLKMALALVRSWAKVLRVVLLQPGVGIVARFRLLRDCRKYMRYNTRLVIGMYSLSRIEDGHLARTKRGRKRQADRAFYAWNDHVDWLEEECKLTDAEIDQGGPDMPQSLQAALR